MSDKRDPACVDCASPLGAAFFGAGDGRGNKFRCEGCHFRGEADTLRTRLTTAERELAEARAERDAWQRRANVAEPEAYDARKRIRLLEMELTTANSFVDARTMERDASDTTRREWEVRAAESYADGRKAGLREAAEACDAQAESWPESPESWFADPGMRHEAVTRRAHRNEAKSCAAKIRRALAPPAAEPRDEGEVSGG